MSLHWLDVTPLVAYFGILVAMGIYFSRKNTSTEEYFVGGRSFSGWVIGLSMVGTSISSVTFLAFPADAFKTAWLRILPGFTLPLAIVIGIPMYSNAAGVIPVVEALLGKGAALGTVLAFMMSVIALSLPEMVILRKVLKMRLIYAFIITVTLGILVVGYLFNWLI